MGTASCSAGTWLQPVWAASGAFGGECPSSQGAVYHETPAIHPLGVTLLPCVLKTLFRLQREEPLGTGVGGFRRQCSHSSGRLHVARNRGEDAIRGEFLPGCWTDFTAVRWMSLRHWWVGQGHVYPMLLHMWLLDSM